MSDTAQFSPNPDLLCVCVVGAVLLEEMLIGSSDSGHEEQPSKRSRGVPKAPPPDTDKWLELARWEGKTYDAQFNPRFCFVCNLSRSSVSQELTHLVTTNG